MPSAPQVAADLPRVRDPLLWIGAATIGTITLLLCVGHLVWASAATSDPRSGAHNRVAQLREQIIDFDQILTMSALLAATTNDPAWQQRYQQYQPRLEAALQELHAITPVAVARQLATETIAAQQHLRNLEQQVFADARNNHPAAAPNVLHSREYAVHKARYAAGADAATDAIDQLLHERIRAHQRHITGVVTTTVAAFAIVALAWVGALYAARAQIQTRQRCADLAATHAADLAAGEAQSRFVAHVSHELRTPMTSIIGFCDTLFEPAASRADCLDAARVIRRNSQHMLTIINDILDFSRMQADGMRFANAPCDVSDLVADLLHTLHHRAKQQNVYLRATLATPIPAVLRTDPIRLRQALLNLLGNALKFTRRGGVTLHIAFDQPAAQILFDVHDTGIGISPQQLDRIFQPFAQADDSIMRRFGGTGLGLSIARRVAEHLGGSLTATSTLGSGSTFHLRIATGAPPAARMIDALETAVSTAPPAPPAGQPLVGCHVLLAEDSPDIQRLLTRIITRAGATVAAVNNGRELLDAVRTAHDRAIRYDILLTDVQMPEMDGMTAVRELRRTGFDQPIIALTAHVTAAQRAACSAAGCDGFLNKPIDRESLIAEINRCRQPAPAPAPA